MTPDPKGYTRDSTWEKLKLAKQAAQAHWSYDEGYAARFKARERTRRREALISAI